MIDSKITSSHLQRRALVYVRQSTSSQVENHRESAHPHVAQAYVDAYLKAVRIGEDRGGLLFRSCRPGRHDVLQESEMSRVGAFKIINRRTRKAGLPAEICAHSFRGTGITEYLRNGGGLEVAARIARLESTCTTQLYSRLREETLLDEIECIHI